MSTTTTLTPQQKGGRAVVKKYGKNWLREIAAVGGETTAEKYGSEYMATIGTLGADAVNGHLTPSARLRTQRLARRLINENQ